MSLQFRAEVRGRPRKTWSESVKKKMLERSLSDYDPLVCNKYERTAVYPCDRDYQSRIIYILVVRFEVTISMSLVLCRLSKAMKEPSDRIKVD